MARIELALHAPKARVMPFHYTEINWSRNTRRYVIYNFCPCCRFSANNTFLTPTGPTLLIVRQDNSHRFTSTRILKPGKSLPGRFSSTHITKCCLSYFGAPWQNRTAVTWLQNRCNTIILIGQKFGGPWEDRTPASCLQSTCATIITNSPNF